MKYSIGNIKLTDDERLWLDSVYQQERSGAEYSPRSLRVRLHNKLSREFDPKQIDNRIYSGMRPTLFGMALIDPESDIVNLAENVINTIQTRILENPEQFVFKVDTLAVDLNASLEKVSRVLHYLSDIGHFWSSASGSGPKGGFMSIEVNSDDCVNEYLRFDGLQTIFNNIEQKILQSSELLPDRRFKEYENRGLVRDIYEANTAFVIMSMNPQNPELEDVSNTIKDVCSRFDITAERVDDIEHSGVITELILERIGLSQYLIADVTGERPNVYYEIGYAHAIGKKPIIVRKAGTTLHFDLSVHNIPEYTNITDLRNILTRRFEAILGKVIEKT